MVYIILVTHPYEFSKCKGVFSSRKKAEKAMSLFKKDSYDQWEIEEFRLDECK